MSGFKLVPFKMTFGRTAWQEMNYYRQQRAAIVANAQSLMATASSAIETSLQNQVSGAANNAAQAALNRINGRKLGSSVNTVA